MQETTLTDAEYKLIHALQIWPRAPWSVLSGALGADPETLARRWSSLTERGLAWVTVQGSGSFSFSSRSGGRPARAVGRGAVVELECAAGTIHSVIDELVLHPECVSVDITSGGRDLLVTLASADSASFSRYVIGRLGQIPGVRSVRTHPVIDTVSTASEWRLRALDRAQVDEIEASRISAQARLRRSIGNGAAADRDVLAVLSADGRATSGMIAEALGIPLRRARDRLNATIACDDVTLRTDMPRWASEWPVCAWYFISVPAAHMATVGEKLRGLREVRTVLAVAGPANLLVSVWLRALEDVGDLEVLLEQKLPSVRILDRCVVLGVRKRMWRVFDEDERALPAVGPLIVQPGEILPGEIQLGEATSLSIPQR